MRATNVEATAEPYRPIDPLPPSDATIWLRLPAAKPSYGLGSKALVWEKTGKRDPKEQIWCWRIVKLGGDRGACKTQPEAMRAAEFVLGVGEREVREK